MDGGLPHRRTDDLCLAWAQRYFGFSAAALAADDWPPAPSTDDPDGSSCRGPQLLRTMWKKPWRVETELNEERDEDGQSEPNRPGQSHEGNAVTKFLTDPTHRDATIGAHRLVREAAA